MLKWMLILIVGFNLLACSGMQWDRPQSRYRDCLQKNPNDRSACDKHKEAYEEQIDSYRESPMKTDPHGGRYDR